MKTLVADSNKIQTFGESEMVLEDYAIPISYIFCTRIYCNVKNNLLRIMFRFIFQDNGTPCILYLITAVLVIFVLIQFTIRIKVTQKSIFIINGVVVVH